MPMLSSFNLLLESAPDTRSRALALSSSLPHAGDWLNVVPSEFSGLGHHLSFVQPSDRFFWGSSAQSSALATRKEVPSLILASNSCPADIFLPNWSRGRPAALDVTVISSMQPLTLAGAAASPGYALQVAEDRKMAAHFEACWAVRVDFVPVAVESRGGRGGGE